MRGKKILKFEQEEVVSDPRQHTNFNYANTKAQLAIQIVTDTPELLQVELQGINPATANALRRIVIAEVPTVAFHKVFMYQNTSIIPDQLLVHRLGLLPISFDPLLIEPRNEGQQLSADNSLKFELKVTCKRKEGFESATEEQLEGKKPQEYLQNCNIYSNQLVWVPQGGQLAKGLHPSLVHKNILIAKLRENQEINLQIYGERGIGKKHAKWSPVSTCFYRLMPSITLKENFNHQKLADTLVGCCPAGVFEKKKEKAVVVRERDCTTCRQCIKLQGVELGKVADHFIFTLESTGIFDARQIFIRGLKVLQEKARSYVI